MLSHLGTLLTVQGQLPQNGQVLQTANNLPSGTSFMCKQLALRHIFHMQTSQSKVLIQPPPPLRFTLWPSSPALIIRVRYQTTKDNPCAPGPIFPEPAETRIKSLAVSSALSASWQTPVFPHVVLHGMSFWFLGMCEYMCEKKILLSS